MLDVYIYDYLVKRKLTASAEAFMAEGKVAVDPVAIDAPGGFLFEWWSVFWDIFIARTNEKHSETAASYIETQQMKAREQQQQQMQMQQLQLIQQRNAQMQRRDPNHPPLSGSINPMNSEAIMGQPSSVAAMKFLDGRIKNSHSLDPDSSTAIMDPNRMALLKSATNYQGQLVRGNSGNLSSAMQQMQGRPQLPSEIKAEVNMGTNQKSLSADPSSIYGQAMLQSKSGLGGAGLNQGMTGLPLKGWPLTGVDHMRPGLQVQKQNLQNQNQFLLASQQQQQQVLAQGNLGGQPNYGFSGIPRSGLNPKDGQLTRNDGSAISSPVQSNSPKMKMQQSSSQPLDQLQHLQQNTRKRKQHTSSGPANSTGTGNTVGPSPNSPANSTHTAGDATASSLHRSGNSSVPKNMMMYGGADAGPGAGIASPTNQLEDIDAFGDVGSLDNVDSFLSNDGGDLYGNVKQTLTGHRTEPDKGFSFGEVGCIRASNKITSCHFSSDGKLLASAGHDKTAVIWNTHTLSKDYTPEEHQHRITDVRFRPNSTQLATASYDRSVRFWDAANPSYCLNAYKGHSAPIISLDFHPKKNNLFCFCDQNNEIHYWNINPFSCTRISKQGGSSQVRFQPRTGDLLGAASDKVISVFDVETDRQTHSFQGHTGVVNYICWDTNGEYLASVAEDSVKVWSLSSRDCVHEFSSNGNQFYSSAFHPSYSSLVVIGGVRCLELWNMAENKNMTVPAHDNIIAALAVSPVSGTIASGSHDTSVKIWK